VLVVAEVALALVLLVSAGLLLRSVERLFSIAPGFDASHVLTMQVQVSGQRFDDAATRRFFDQSVSAVRAVPGVDVSAFTSQLPLSGDADVYGAQLEHDNDPRDDHSVYRYAVTPSYFAVMRIPLRHGRLLDERDLVPGERGVVVNESFAKRKFPGQDAVGQRIRVGGVNDRPWDVIVGVVGDVKQSSLTMGESGAVYVAASQWLWADNPQWLVVRAHGDAASLTGAVQRAVWSVDKDQPIVRVATMEHLLDASEAQRRFALIVFEGFALAALVLAATGIYGVISGRVSERLREIGIRSALGASRGSILGLVVRHGLSLTGAGVILGVGAAMMATRAVTTLLYGVTHLDPATYVGVVVLLVLMSLVACALPAWRAARVDPSITLRSE
jgi:putative ABC transport system permease protein